MYPCKLKRNLVTLRINTACMKGLKQCICIVDFHIQYLMFHFWLLHFPKRQLSVKALNLANILSVCSFNASVTMKKASCTSAFIRRSGFFFFWLPFAGNMHFLFFPSLPVKAACTFSEMEVSPVQNWNKMKVKQTILCAVDLRIHQTRQNELPECFWESLKWPNKSFHFHFFVLLSKSSHYTPINKTKVHPLLQKVRSHCKKRSCFSHSQSLR